MWTSTKLSIVGHGDDSDRVGHSRRAGSGQLDAFLWIFSGIMLIGSIVVVIVMQEASGGPESRVDTALNTAREVHEQRLPLSFLSGSQGWVVSVLSIPHGARKLRYRTQAEGWSEVEVSSGARFELPADQRATTLQIAFVDARGHELASFDYHFEPEAELASSMRRLLEQTWSGWVALNPWADGKTLVYFTTLVVYRCGLSEVRYGLDGAPVTTRYELPECNPYDPSRQAIGRDVQPYIDVPHAVQSITVQLTYRDGTRSQPHTYKSPR